MTIIKAGWGNKRHNHYYPASTLQEAAKAGVFNNLRMYANHLSDAQRKLLGGLPRDIRDITGRILETWWDAPTQSLKGKAKLVPWFYSLIESDPGIVEASINAGGRATPKVIEGRKGRLVESIVAGESVDWVPVGGAGGKIDSLLEAHMEEQTHMYEDLTLEGLVEGNAALVQEILNSPLNERAKNAEERIAALEAELATAKESKPAETEPVVEAEPVDQPDIIKLTEAEFEQRVEDRAKAIAEAAVETARTQAKIEGARDKLIESAAGLKAKSKSAIARQFEGVEFESLEAMTEAVQGAIDERLEELKEALGDDGSVVGLGPSTAADVIQARRQGRRRGFDAVVDRQMDIDEPATPNPAETVTA